MNPFDALTAAEQSLSAAQELIPGPDAESAQDLKTAYALIEKTRQKYLAAPPQDQPQGEGE